VATTRDDTSIVAPVGALHVPDARVSSAGRSLSFPQAPRPQAGARPRLWYVVRVLRPPDPRSARRLKVVAVLLVVIMLAAAQRLGILEQFAEPKRVAKTLLDLGPWGYVVFITAYTLLQPFGIPGTVFVVAASLIWPWPIAFALSMTGTMSASVVGFSFARLVARDWISRFIPARFKKYNASLEKRGFTTVLTLRLIFWMPPLLHAFFGVSRVRFWTHFWGSLAGYVIPLFAVSFFGPKVFDALKDAPPHVWAALGASFVAALAIGWFVRRRMNRGRPDDDVGDEDAGAVSDPAPEAD
jgi:uncharacterized membrane protein YdjX (TVP38/TMEM64 family)